jgi:hypothetical protein
MHYPDHTPDQVYAMLSRQDFREAVCEYQGYPRRTVTIAPTGSGMAVKVDQYRPATEVPSFARKLVGEEINILQEEEWTSHTDMNLEVSIPGKPGTMIGTVTLREQDGGTVETVDVEVKVNIPLVGGKLETFIGDMLLRALKAENKVGLRWLAEGK